MEDHLDHCPLDFQISSISHNIPPENGGFFVPFFSTVPHFPSSFQFANIPPFHILYGIF